MDFAVEMTLPSPPARVWDVLTDFRRAAACVPGCEEIEEVGRLQRYRAVMRQRVGPFRLEAPVEIVVEEARAPSVVRARASGRDRLTGTSVSAGVVITLAAAAGGGSALSLALDVQVTGRLATLGYPVIRQRTRDLVDEFGRRLGAVLSEP